MSTPPSLAELARARRAGWDDASRGLPVEDYPFEFADGPLFDAWLDGYRSWALDERQTKAAPSQTSRVLAILGVSALSVFGAAISITWSVPTAACAFGVLYGGYLGFHLGLCVKRL